MSQTLYAIYAVLLTGLAALFFVQFARGRRAGTLALALVTAGLWYDNLILAIGNFIGAGPLLHGLSIPRFVLHQLILPWLILGAFEIARAAGAGWAESRAAYRVALAGSFVVMVAGILTRLIGLRLEPETLDGVLRYAAVGVKGPPLVSILSVGFAGVVGAWLWCKRGWPWLFLAVALAFAVEALPGEAVKRALGSGLEVALMAVLYWKNQAGVEKSP